MPVALVAILAASCSSAGSQVADGSGLRQFGEAVLKKAAVEGQTVEYLQPNGATSTPTVVCAEKTGHHPRQFRSPTDRFERLTAVIEREDDGFVALCPEYDIASQGSSVVEARASLIEALELFVESASASEIAEQYCAEVPIS